MMMTTCSMPQSDSHTHATYALIYSLPTQAFLHSLPRPLSVSVPSTSAPPLPSFFVAYTSGGVGGASHFSKRRGQPLPAVTTEQEEEKKKSLIVEAGETEEVVFHPADEYFERGEEGRRE